MMGEGGALCGLGSVASYGQRPLSLRCFHEPHPVRSASAADSFAVNNSQRHQPSDLLRLNEANGINRIKRPAWSSASTCRGKAAKVPDTDESVSGSSFSNSQRLMTFWTFPGKTPCTLAT